jgi:hypothetical protein
MNILIAISHELFMSLSMGWEILWVFGTSSD